MISFSIQIPFFDDVGVKILINLDTLLQCSNLQKSQFYKGLPEALSKLPHRVRIQQVLPCLARDLMQPTMVPFVLPNLLDIAQDCNQREYIDNILPHLKPLMKLLDPIQVSCGPTTCSRNAGIAINFYYVKGHANRFLSKSFHDYLLIASITYIIHEVG